MTTKQDNRDMNRNPEGNGGFRDNPQNRHSGAWKKVDTFRYWYDTFKEMSVSDLKTWQKDNPEETRKVVANLAFNAVVRADKDLKYLVEITDRTEGKSKQSIKHEGDLNITMQMKKLESVVDDLLSEDTEDTETN